MKVAHLWALSVQDCRLTQFLKEFSAWVGKLAFLRKRPVGTAGPSALEAEAHSRAPVEEVNPSADAADCVVKSKKLG